MTSKLTRERIELIANFHRAMTLPPSHAEIEELARMALAAMDSEPHTDDELSNLLWYSQEATCHSDPNYYCEFQRLATPGLIAGIIRELQERRKAAMDSRPVILYRQINPVNGMKTYWAELDPEEFRHLKQHTDENAEFMTLYRHAQPAPVVPAVSDDIGEIRVGRLPTMSQDDYPGLGDWWVQLRIGEDSDEVLARVYGATPQEANNRAEALACRAAMLSGGKS
ncbi:Uncharacterised protein [Klebsiella quasipneumoniae]|uniref:hypothetical protein n=1 Tax=Klebsiella quasipneumoniae TaxID=1463165 RepID=UPI0009CEA336|nr:hypothetical protein [Klebsiella quasipneumoniae]SLX36771.1 Uncharacterised protein [Klebsiella quasipneumoniae]SLX43962.1 Uncharacterised protein [Klebsiella quasipneumoniae]SLX44122.1 Uncharacterised protein [Klebsiella quasipneumoniae]SLX49537.1 Uncharacterised protein [Klebsiella quasipneumoniae]SLX59350.1 Uncharacterised protein [Klebsiella quasipneumoniae]